MLKARIVLSGCFVLALLGAGWCAVTLAGKPAPPPPPPPAPGKIYYEAESQGFFQMNGNGSGKTAVPFIFPPDASFPVPSLASYGTGHRWWLAIREPGAPNQTDLYATKDGSSWIQVTASTITPNADGTETHVRFLYDPCWSNDGTDGFCSVKATYYIYDPATGTGWDIHRIIYVLDISASDLEAIAQGAAYTPLSVGNNRVIPIITAPVPVDHSVEPLVEHHWSHDATKITFVRNSATPGAPKDLYVADVSDVSHGPVAAANASMIYHSPGNFEVFSPHWTPHGNTLASERIAFVCNESIYTVLPDATGIFTVTTSGVNAFWSPDGKYIVYQVPVYFVHGWIRSYDIARLPSSMRGTVVTLTADSNYKNIWGWLE